MSFHWKGLSTEQRIEAIKAAHEPGMSASAIAAALGGDVTRNAVIGMYGRHAQALAGCPLGGGRRRSQATANRRYKQARGGKTAVAAPPQPARRPIILLDFGAIRQHRPADPLPETSDSVSQDMPLSDLGPSDCRWPTNEASKGEAHLFCGHMRLPSSPYCERHHMRAYRAE